MLGYSIVYDPKTLRSLASTLIPGKVSNLANLRVLSEASGINPYELNLELFLKYGSTGSLRVTSEAFLGEQYRGLSMF